MFSVNITLPQDPFRSNAASVWHCSALWAASLPSGRGIDRSRGLYVHRTIQTDVRTSYVGSPGGIQSHCLNVRAVEDRYTLAPSLSHAIVGCFAV